MRNLSTVTIALVLAFLPAAATSAADPAAWSAGLASVKITPQKPVVLAGYAARTKPFEVIDHDIYAKAVALKDSDGHRAVLVTLDLCILPRDVGEQIRGRIGQRTQIEPAAIVLNVAHSHSAPAVALEATAAAPGSTTRPLSVNAANEDTVEYTRWMCDRAVDATVDACEHLQPAKLSWSTGIAHFAVNRRQFTDKGVVLGVNPRGPTDRSVPVLRIDDPNGRLRGVVLGYACHNTTAPSNRLGVSGDYAGYAKAYIEQQLPGVQALFVCGCGADANPYPRQKPGDAEALGEQLGKEVCRLLGEPMKPVRGPLTCADAIAELPLRTPDRVALEEIRQKGSGVDKQTAQQLLYTLDGGKPLRSICRSPVVVWQFGKDLTLVTLPDEVVVDYVIKLEEAMGPLRLWVAGYSNQVTGYIPSERILREGGYETRGLYTEVGWFAPGVEAALVKAARQAATKAGRDLPATTAP